MTDPHSVTDQARREIAQIAKEIQELGRNAQTADEYLPRFLELLTSAVGSLAGVIWMRDDDGHIRMPAEVRWAETGIPDNPPADGANLLLLREAVSKGQARYYAHDSEACSRLPNPMAIVFAPLHDQSGCVGAVELFQKPGASEEARRGYLQFVEQMAGYASTFLAGPDKQSSDEGPGFWNDLAEVALGMQSSLNPAEVTSTAANDGRALLNCDQVSVVTRRGRKVTVDAVSGQDTVNHRANVIRSMRKLAKLILPTRETFTYSGQTGELTSEIKDALAEYLVDGRARRLTIVPLFPPDPFHPRRRGKSDTVDVTEDKTEPFGCLIVEETSGESGGQELVQRAELLADHVGAALANARAYRQIFLRPVFSAIGNCREWMMGRAGAKLLAALAVIAVIITALVVIPYDYRVAAEGRLMPVEQQSVYAPWDGRVTKIHVRAGDRVKQNDLLLTLENPQLQYERKTLGQDLGIEQKRLTTLEARATVTDDKDESTRIAGQINETKERIAWLERRRDLLDDRIKALKVRAPIAGVVATFRVEELLQRRPVSRGELLIEIANDKGPWRLELEVEEHRMGHLLEAQRSRRPERLPVEYMLATEPTKNYEGELQTIATRPKRVPERGSIVEMYGAFGNNKQPEKRIGAEVRAKISCGKRSLGYVLFGDVVEFVRSRLWL